MGGVPGETGYQQPPGDWSDAGGGKSTYAEGAQNTPEPRWHGGYHDHGYNPGTEEGGAPSAHPGRQRSGPGYEGLPPYQSVTRGQAAGLLGEGGYTERRHPPATIQSEPRRFIGRRRHSME